MKKKFTIVLTVLLGFGLVWDYSNNQATSFGGQAPAGRTGSPGDGLSCFSGCHGGNPGTASGSESVVLSGLPSSGYVAGTTYDLTLSASESSVSKFGFELAAQDVSGNALGTLISGTGSTLVGSGEYLTHSPSGTSTGTQDWNFQWTAPVSGSGTVGLYYAVVFADGNFSNSGDVMITGNELIGESTVGITEEDPFEIEIYPNPVSDKITIDTDGLKGLLEVKIFSISGTKVVDETFDKNKVVLNLLNRGLNTGIYLLQIESSNKKMIKKILVK